MNVKVLVLNFDRFIVKSFDKSVGKDFFSVGKFIGN